MADYGKTMRTLWQTMKMLWQHYYSIVYVDPRYEHYDTVQYWTTLDNLFLFCWCTKVQDFIQSIKHKVNMDRTVRTHSVAILKEFMDQIHVWATEQLQPLSDRSQLYSDLIKGHLLDLHTASVEFLLKEWTHLIRMFEMLAFSTMAWNLWTRCLSWWSWSWRTSWLLQCLCTTSSWSILCIRPCRQVIGWWTSRFSCQTRKDGSSVSTIEKGLIYDVSQPHSSYSLLRALTNFQV